jgi:integrase
LIATTGVRDAHLAKIIGCEILAAWRRHFVELDQNRVDIVRLSFGSPALANLAVGRGLGLMPITEAANHSGIDVNELVRFAAEGQLRLYVAPQVMPGFFVRLDELDREVDEFSEGMVVPLPYQMPESAIGTSQPGALRMSTRDAHAAAVNLQAGNDCRFMLFEVPGQPKMGFAPSGGFAISYRTLSLASGEVEAQRQLLASLVTPDQLAAAKAVHVPEAMPQRPDRRFSTAVVAYMAERSKSCNLDQARRVRAACDLFTELMDDPLLRELQRDDMRRYRDVVLPTVPANENKVRLQHKTSTITESIQAVAGSTWPTISRAEQVKRMQWLCAMFEWLKEEKWIADDPADGLARQPRRRDKRDGADHAKRDLFTPDELKTIFRAPWFASGRGALNRAGTYREFLPFYYWLPLLGLYTGARINELCQLSLKDIQQTSSGTWFVDINEEDDEDKKRVKNTNSIRRIPLHPVLMEKGLVEWCERLKADGHARLFPELPHDATKGYGKKATKWFSTYLGGLGWRRDGRKVFHSFRHTLSSRCLNELGLPEALVAQISGHMRSQSILGGTYRKDVLPDDLVQAVERIAFELPPIAAFDLECGIQALGDAMRRMK